MASTTETYNYAYSVIYSGGSYKLVDANPGSPGVNPVADGIKVRDPDGGSLSSGESVRIPNIASGSLGTSAKYDFVGTATLQGADGIIVEDKSGNLFFLTDSAYTGNLNGNHGTLKSVDTSTTISLCFMAGTLIRTPDGEVAVETLKHGNQVLTHDGRVATVDWLGVQTISLRFADKLRVLPIRIKTGALGDNVPARDLLVSPDHAILVEGALIHAGALVNGTSIVRETDVPATFTYYHVEVEDHSLILAENTPAETFVDNIDRLHFDNWAEHEALYPNGKPINELPYPRAKSHRQVPVATRVMLAARAQALSGSTDDSAAA
ncbi:Hint domain-containing protein [Bradyrhizobium ontarionense]|uniref:Hint domain-containing protein n=1 Tax=Bradyrhizobium ontarionense TaxID=2898149 RepID=A0ABY3R3H5_9BRAD|nr:Hint domain-containing protein [Bradyrhizobium sp. A19]UFZ01810.1 Hint domain-containing protein [Bradyrhizobium sp. A19]